MEVEVPKLPVAIKAEAEEEEPEPPVIIQTKFKKGVLETPTAPVKSPEETLTSTNLYQYRKKDERVNYREVMSNKEEEQIICKTPLLVRLSAYLTVGPETRSASSQSTVPKSCMSSSARSPPAGIVTCSPLANSLTDPSLEDRLRSREPLPTFPCEGWDCWKFRCWLLLLDCFTGVY